jgi:hypothetical protein
MTEIKDFGTLVTDPNLTDLFVGQTAAGGAGSAFRVSLANLIASGLAGGAIDDLSNVTVTSPTSGQLLQYNGAAWVNAPNSGTAVAYNDTLFVGKHGNDSNNGSAPGTPFLTIDAAITAATSLGPAIDNRVAIQVLDAGDYTDEITQPDYVTIEAPKATLYGTILLGDNTQTRFFRIRATGNGQYLLRKAGGSETSYVYVSELDGTGPTSTEAPGDGSRTNTDCVQNNSNSSILFVFTPKIWVPQGGYGVGDSSAQQGHVHVNVEDLYLVGDGATGVNANQFSASVILRFGHILELGNPSNCVGIRVTTGSYCYALGAEIAIPNGKAWDINGTGALDIVCPVTEGTMDGYPRTAYTDRLTINPNLPTSASGLPSGAFWNDSGTLKVVP